MIDDQAHVAVEQFHSARRDVLHQEIDIAAQGVLKSTTRAVDPTTDRGLRLKRWMLARPPVSATKRAIVIAGESHGFLKSCSAARPHTMPSRTTPIRHLTHPAPWHDVSDPSHHRPKRTLPPRRLIPVASPSAGTYDSYRIKRT